MMESLKNHWPEYLIEASALGFFMISACMFGALLGYPGSPLYQSLPDPFLRRLLGGIAMGLTAIAIIYSPWGKQSGAHMNPAVTLTFFRLGKVAKWDAIFYPIAQFIGGVAGVILSSLILGEILKHPTVNYVATLPGPEGIGIAFVGELVISFGLMFVILFVTNRQNLARFTGMFAGLLVATYITLESPLSGMSMNPARTLGSAIPGNVWMAIWIYFAAPPIGMLLASEFYLRIWGPKHVECAKLHHQNKKRCIFCQYQESKKQQP